MLLQQLHEKIMRKKKFSKLVSSCQYYCLLGTVHTTSSAGGFDCCRILRWMSDNMKPSGSRVFIAVKEFQEKALQLNMCQIIFCTIAQFGLTAEIILTNSRNFLISFLPGRRKILKNHQKIKYFICIWMLQRVY